MVSDTTQLFLAVSLARFYIPLAIYKSVLHAAHVISHQSAIYGCVAYLFRQVGIRLNTHTRPRVEAILAMQNQA